MAIKQDAAIRKRQQIAKANQLMFAWVAGASVIVGASAVVIVLLVQHLLFNQTTISAKLETVDNLKYNNSIVDKIKDNVRVLNTNESLLRLKVPADKDAVQVVFDSLPSTPNSASLGSSLQSPLLLGQPNVKVESLTVSPIAGVEDATDGTTTSDQTTDQPNGIHFDFAISTDKSNPDALKNVMRKLELSIRAINVTNLRFEIQGDRLLVTASGYGYYEPAKNVELKEETMQ